LLLICMFNGVFCCLYRARNSKDRGYSCFSSVLLLLTFLPLPFEVSARPINFKSFDLITGSAL
ncbi:hypothetical protein NDU88_004411, partial [Pleurodeles waltl]